MQNNYSNKEGDFLKKTGININNGFDKKSLLSKSVSIIIPFYNNLKIFQKCFLALQHQYIPDRIKDKIELIIIDDGSAPNQKRVLANFLQKENKLFNITLLQFLSNRGRAIARNTGILHAKGEVIIFLDSDILAEKYLIVNHLLRHQFSEKIAIIGFRENINYNNNSIRSQKLRKGILPKPDYKKDFRYKKFVPANWKNVYRDIADTQFNKTYFLLKDTEFFKNFTSSEMHGVWTLPFMFLTCNVSVERKEAIKVGGFDMNFKGWGVEDTHFAYKLLKNKVFLVPVISAISFHIKHNNQKDNERKIQDYKKNLALYKIKTRVRQKKYRTKEWEKRLKTAVGEKYNLIKILPKK